MGEKVNGRRFVVAEEFVKAWQSASCLEAAAAALGVDRAYANGRASSLRRSGVKLKKFNPAGRPKLDLERLNKIAKESNSDR